MPDPRSDLLLEVPGVTDVDNPATTADSRFRTGHPRQTQQGSTATDATFARRITAAIPAERMPAYDADDAPLPPDRADAHVDVKRTLAYKPATGFSFITGARFNLFLKSNFEVRVADGAAMMAAVDQDFVPDPKNAPTVTRPGLSYLRLGKPETALVDAEGNDLERQYDQMMDQKYGSGIGLFSDGGLSAWTRQPLSFRSNEGFYITAPAYSLSSYGESKIISYELNNKDDIAKVNSGAFADVGVDRKIINVNWLRPTDMGWYRQIFDRGKALSFSTANRGDFATGAGYSLGIGAKFEHAISVGLGTSYAGKVDISKGFSMEIGATGATFKHPFGSWTQEVDAEISGYKSVFISTAGVDTAPMTVMMTGFSIALHAAVAVQTAAFTLYNGVLAAKADTTLTAKDAQDKGDDTHGLLTALEDGVRVYEAAVALSAITCAAGCVLAAAQALWARTRMPDPVTSPNIEVSRLGIFLRYGSNGLQITPAGVRIVGLVGGVTIGGPVITHSAAAVNHSPVPPPVPILPRLV